MLPVLLPLNSVCPWSNLLVLLEPQLLPYLLKELMQLSTLQVGSVGCKAPFGSLETLGKILKGYVQKQAWALSLLLGSTPPVDAQPCFVGNTSLNSTWSYVSLRRLQGICLLW